uniref:Immunoglobulin domain-containing protein n=1 Tax=Paramormyrops kingsleyae TaxID=1676925 RepID=A0A3B3RK91_9TELE
HSPHLGLLLLGNFHTVPAGVSTMKRVSVQRGGSVTIPCFYGDGYETHVKYWCRGYNVSSCTPIVHSDSPQEGKVSIRDDPDQRVFTVTINNLTAGDSDYVCYYSVCSGSPWLSVDKQEVTGVEGDSVSVQYHYTDDYGQRMWCKFGGSCAAVNSGSLDGRPVLIRDDRVNKVFSVTMRGLERKDTGWYWCDIGVVQIPVHITVKHFTVQMHLRTQLFGPVFLYVGLGLLVLLLIIVIIAWKVWDKHSEYLLMQTVYK